MAGGDLSRKRLARAGVALALALAGAACARATERDPARPDVLVVLADDLGRGDLSRTGHPLARTPRMDALAGRGAWLEACYAASPNCSPARAGLLTGRGPLRTGVVDAIATRGELRLAEAETTLAELLRAAGYDTFHAGKWHLTPPGAGERAAPGRPHGFDASADTSTAERHMRAAEVVDAFEAWLDARPDPARPWLAYLAFYEVHTPVAAKVDAALAAALQPERPRRAVRSIPTGGVVRPRANPALVGAYLAGIAEIDRAVGRLVDRLDADGALGPDGRTLLLVTSDNGPEARREDSFGSPGPFRGAKSFVYEGGIRVPAILVWPGVARPGSTVAAATSHLDLVPTLCAALGLAPPADELDGVDLRPALAGDPLPRRLWWMHWCAPGGVQLALRDGRWKLCAATEPLRADQSVREHLRRAELVRFELYDLESDPAEERDLAAERPQVVARLAQALAAARAAALADGPEWELEELRVKAALAWPELFDARGALDAEVGEDER